MGCHHEMHQGGIVTVVTNPNGPAGCAFCREAALKEEVERLKRALGEVAAHADRCEECDCGEAKIATHVTMSTITGLPLFLCPEHAEEIRAAYKKAESKGCGKSPDIEEHEQETTVQIALQALGEGR